MSKSHPFPLICLTKELYTRPLVLTPQQIGVIEHKKNQLLKVAQALLFIQTCLNGSGVMPNWLHVTLSTRCHPLFLMEHPLNLSYFLLLNTSIRLLEFLDMFVTITILFKDLTNSVFTLCISWLFIDNSWCPLWPILIVFSISWMPRTHFSMVTHLRKYIWATTWIGCLRSIRVVSTI